MKKYHQKLFAGFLSLLLLAALMTGCGASKAEAPAAQDMAKEEITQEPTPPEAAPSTPGEALDTGSGQTARTVTDPSQKIIYSASLQLETTAFDGATAAVDKLVADFGGFVENANVDGNIVYGPDGATRVENRTARYTLRVPSEKFETALKQAGSIGNVTASSRNAENITSQFVDSEARRDSLNVQEKRLLAMMEKSVDVETLVALESRLCEVRYELESLERQLRNWQTQVDFSTIELSISEVELYTPTAAIQRSFGEKLATSFKDGLNRFGRGLQNLTLGLAGALPLLVLLAVAAIVAIVIVRKIRRKRRAAHQPPPENPPTK